MNGLLKKIPYKPVTEVFPVFISSFINREFLVMASIVFSTIVSTAYISHTVFGLLKAQEFSIPEGYTALEYIHLLERADINNDGVINLFDYSIMLDEQYGKDDAFVQSDINNDQKANALDASFVISYFSSYVEEEKQKVLSSPEYAKEISKDIADANEKKLPVEDANDIVLFSANDPNAPKTEYGRIIIPTVLGTVSNYTGSASYDFDVDVPAGPGGLKPSVGISYSSLSVDDGRGKNIPSQLGLGFSLIGTGSIIRDAKYQKEVYRIGDTINHDYILNLPGGLSAKLEYNLSTGRWVSVPESFLKIEHRPPGEVRQGKHKYLDPWSWEITTKDGMKYYLGEEDIASKLEDDARIKGSEKTREGTKNGNLYNEFDFGRSCIGTDNVTGLCDRWEDEEKLVIISKWLLRKIETPDGRTINYSYEVQQKKYGDASKYITTSSYPEEILWNDEKHRLRITREGRKDMGDGDFVKERIKEIIVETKQENDGQYHVIRKYNLTYFDGRENTKENLGVRLSRGVDIPTDEGIKNDVEASYLTSIREYGTNGQESLPPITFRYVQFYIDDDYKSDNIYLASINNGYGGLTQFSYEKFDLNWIRSTGKAIRKTVRARVKEKTITDMTTPAQTSSKEIYTYGNTLGYIEKELKVGDNRYPISQEFLGHSNVEIKQYDFDGSIVKHHEMFFFQGIGGNECLEAHAAKGRIHKEITYKGEAKEIAQVVDTRYKYRLEGEDGLNPSEKCGNKLASQPLFLYTYDITTYTKEDPKNFLPDIVMGKIDEKNLPKSEMRTLQRTLKHDQYGNELLSVHYGEVDQNGYDIDTSDNRYYHKYFLTDGAQWIKSLPYVSYMSNKEDCGKDNTSCQWERTIMTYDNFDKNYWELTWEEMQPRWGFLTQKQTWIDDNIVTVEGYDYDDLSGNNKDDDRRKGEKTRIYAPKSSVVSISKPKEEVMLIKSMKYDPYYHTLLLEESNALGHKIVYDDYDYLLQVPKFVKRQIQKDSELYAVSKFTYDTLGRIIASFEPNPENPGSSIDYPSSITSYFEKNNEGLIVRKAKLVSVNNDTPYYNTTDTFYDGLGNDVQVQTLQTRVNNEDKRRIETKQFQIDGLSSEEYETQIADPIILDGINGTNYHTVLSSIKPKTAETAKIVKKRTTYDFMRRPIEITAIETVRGDRYSEKTEYLANAKKDTNVKGVEIVTIQDVWGREIYEITYSPKSNQALIAYYEYSQSMLDKPTNIIKTDHNGVRVETKYGYDKSGRVLTKNDPSLGKYKYTYNVYGNILTESGEENEKNWFTYDALGRLEKKGFDDLGNSLDDGGLYYRNVRSEVKYQYDDGSYALGKLVKIEHITGSKKFSYDKGQRLTSTKVKTFDNEREFTTQYDLLGKEKLSKYPDGTETKKEYDKEGKIAGMFINGQKVMDNVLYDKYGNAVQSNIYNSNTQNINTYKNKIDTDSLGRIRKLELTNSQYDVGGFVTDINVLSQEMEYNNASEVNKLTDSVGNKTDVINYNYDEFSQLTSVISSAYNTTYKYDMFGRMLEKNEEDKVVMAYDSQFPFYAPKNVEIEGEFEEEADVTPTATPSLSPTSYPSSSPIPSQTQSLTPSLEPRLFGKSSQNTVKGVSKRTMTFNYTKEGNMEHDERNCYKYNREGELVKLGIKQKSKGACADENYKKIYMFYYDDEGTLNLQEEYNPSDMSKPLKEIYYFGVYEEEITN